MRLFLAASLLALALTGCDAASFNAVNSSVIASRQVAVKANAAPLPAAAIAAGLGALELVKALSTSSKATSSPALFRLAALSTGDQDVVNADSKVNMHLRYTSSVGAGGTTSASITSFTGTAQGYAVDATGSFSFDPTGTIGCQMAGSISYGDTAFTVKALKLATTYPLPARSAEIGSCEFEQLDGGAVKAALTATLAVDAGGKIVATGQLTQDGTTTELANFGQDNVAL